MVGKSILVVDDTLVAQNFIRLVLTHEGYEVRTASHAVEALQVMASFCPELVLTEVNLPGIDGLELARRIKNDPRTATVKVVALTTADPADQARVQQADCDGFIAKPIETRSLTQHIRETLARPIANPAAKLTAPAADPIAAGLNGEAADHLRRSFLKEGAEKSAELVESLDHGFDAAHAARLLHSWAGAGGMAGFPEITKLARACEEALRAGAPRHSEFRDTLGVLAFTFADLNETHGVQIPEHVVRALQGKRIAMVAFPSDRADFLCATLEQVKARPRLYTGAAAIENIESVETCELILVRVGPESAGSPWLDPSRPLPSGGTLVLAGDRRDLLNLPAPMQSRDVEFLVDTWHPEDVVVHLHRALSRRAATESQAQIAEPAPAGSQPADPSRAAAAPAKASVIIADDDKLIVSVLGSTLQNYGMPCQEAANGEEALRLIREHRPAVAVLDVNMPGLDGYEVLAAVRKEELPVMVILLTARNREADILRGFQLGADDYMVKPFNPLELIARLKRLLKK